MLVATLLMRDEEDILDEWFAHHKPFVDVFIVTDNASTDQSAAIAHAHGATVITETKTNFYQSAWVSRMASMAYELGADWVFHADADEFWSGMGGLEYLNPETEVARVTTCRWHDPGPPVPEPFRRSHMPNYVIRPYRKIAHRTGPVVRTAMGNHAATHTHGNVQDVNFITIDHYPIRTYAQFRKKVIQGGESYLSYPGPIGDGWHWRKWYEDYLLDRLPEVYKNLTAGSRV